ncbi:hypothetical protein WICPIJ_000363 [Wickerhamomyces pijperi]|uniref:LisH domain-containing protein n=1 Tax=Wickerhamomyces pijperi TaxID=599730 RepID=A0A9P8QDR0_WICPI|nr:hypothetical protein WICPIJ_000363 [Wickerhamomyces pijperi]
MSSTSLNSKVPKYTAGTSGGTNSNSNSRYPQSSSSINTPVNSGGGGGGGGTSSASPAEKFVTDAHFSNSKQLLNAYVYDFLIKSSLPETAQSFIKEADVPTGHPTTKTIKRPPQKDLLPLAISLDAPQGFLYEWWQIFWDVFNARTHRGGSENAQHYYQLQLARQQREIALHNSTLQAAHHQQLQLQQMNQQQQQQQLQYQQQLSQTIGMPQLNSTGQVAGQLPNGSFSPQISFPPGGTTPVPMAGNMQQFIMSQQWLQQQQKQLAATMSNGGRMMMGNFPPPPQQQQQQLKRGNDIEEINANRSAQAQVQYQMNQMRQQQMQQQLQQQNGARAPVNLSASPAKKQKLEDKSTKEISEDKDGEKDGSASGSSALQDYQLQLMLLERENKKMLTNKSKETSTSNGNTPNTVTTASATKRSKKDGNSSPLLNNKMPPPKGKGASPALSAGSNANIVSPGSIAESKKKKEPVRRGRGKKKDAALSNPPTPTTPLTPSQIVNSSTNASKREPTTSTIMEEHGEDSLGTADPSHFNHHQQRLNQHTINPTDLSPGSSQLTPPTSDSHKSTNGGNKQESTLSHLKMNGDDDFSAAAAASAAATENFGSQMLSSGNQHVDSDNDEDAFGGFGALGDFQNDLNNENFNLENFLNQGHDAGDDDVGLGGDVGAGFESYWRDSVSN